MKYDVILTIDDSVPGVGGVAKMDVKANDSEEILSSRAFLFKGSITNESIPKMLMHVAKSVNGLTTEAIDLSKKDPEYTEKGGPSHTVNKPPVQRKKKTV